MKKKTSKILAAPAVIVLSCAVGCGAESGSPLDGNAGQAGTGTGGDAGRGGAAGQTGTGGNAGAGGNASQTGVDPYKELEQLHVNGEAANTSDSNPGTKDKPLATVSEGLSRAVKNRGGGKGTRVWIHPGVYRETVKGNYSAASGGKLIVLQATDANKARIAGSDYFTGWKKDAGIYSHTWTQDWFTKECSGGSGKEACNPNPGSLSGLGVRRELVFIDGKLLDPQKTLADTQKNAASFYVDEQADKLYLNPPSGVTPDKALVEVGMRERLLEVRGLSDLVLKGLTFEHAVTKQKSTEGAVRLADQDNVLIEDCQIVHNSWDGLGLASTKGLVIRRSKINHNGFNGLAAHIIEDTLIEDTEASFNNWRGGKLGGLYGWSVGNKILKSRKLLVRRMTANDNDTHGLWLDYDHEDTVVEDSEFCRNREAGIITEANQGPIVIRGNKLCENGSGLQTRETHKLDVLNNTFTDNLVGVQITGQVSRPVREFETCQKGEENNCNCGKTKCILPSGCVCYRLSNRNWNVKGNSVTGTGDGKTQNNDSDKLIWGSLKEDEIKALFESSVWENNTYFHTHGEGVFYVAGCGYWSTLSSWQSCTGADKSSVWKKP